MILITGAMALTHRGSTTSGESDNLCAAGNFGDSRCYVVSGTVHKQQTFFCNFFTISNDIGKRFGSALVDTTDRFFFLMW